MDGIIGILCYHDLELLKQCIQHARGSVPKAMIYVWDNSNDDINANWLKKYCIEHNGKVDYDTNGKNMGISYAYNKICNYAINLYCRTVSILNQDCLVNPDWHDYLTYRMAAFDNAGMVGFSQANKGFEADRFTGQVSEIAGEVFMLRLRAWKDIGQFDEGFIYYSLDSEFQQRGNLRTKWRTYVVDENVVGKQYEHLQHHSTRVNPQLWNQAEIDVKRWQIIKEGYDKELAERQRK